MVEVGDADGGCGVGAGAADSVFGAVSAESVFGGGAVDGGSGEVSTRAASVMSDDALRNSRMLLPSAAPTSGSLPGPDDDQGDDQDDDELDGPDVRHGWRISTSRWRATGERPARRAG